MQSFQQAIVRKLKEECHTTLDKATTRQLYNAVSKAALDTCLDTWEKPVTGKIACYFSAEFLVGRLIHSNLLNLDLLEETESLLKEAGIHPNVFEDVEDDALGNGGLGRLAACFLDSAATQGIPLMGFGIRYRYGLFRQRFVNGCQQEEPDDWLAWGDPWSIRREEEKVRVDFGDQSVWAVPYDMPVIGYGGKMVNTLRLWQAEAIVPFDFKLFNEQKYSESVRQKSEAEAISAVLYPNDDTEAGKRLRLKQQYFFSSASLQTIFAACTKKDGTDYRRFADAYAIQLNDTHPTVSIPELLRLLMTKGHIEFEPAFQIVRNTFAYTNHTIMAEALEKWSLPLFQSVLPEVYPYVVMLQNRLSNELANKHITDSGKYNLIQDGMVHMARMAIYATHSTNGVAKIHTEIIKKSALPEWYALYPERFNNKTNGVTQRRWLALCNRELASFLDERIGRDWITDFSQLSRLRPYADDPDSRKQFRKIKHAKKMQLADYIRRRDHFELHTDHLFDIQIKRLHEYKRQLLNAFSILDIYFGLKEGRIRQFYSTTFIFGAKAAPGYYRARGIIHFINEVADLVNHDDDVNRKMQVVFVSNYNVSYAEKLIPAADISEQISTAGTEASGTGNMKFMMNGALTLGTYDGANIEIVQNAGMENNYIFGARVEDLEKISDSYDPEKLYEREPRIRRVMDTLVDGTFNDGGYGWFEELYQSILKGASWHKPDPYYLLLDFLPYCDARLRANRDYGDPDAFAKKCLLNIAAAGPFTSDRTVRQYAGEIWHI
ncbi:MAG TPA: glycogen phosphorylase [Clostridiales bacterium]|jgi:starch phosphorylase|nr:glycogen phosphorylase [Clostridiales bacterium]